MESHNDSNCTCAAASRNGLGRKQAVGAGDALA